MARVLPLHHRRIRRGERRTPLRAASRPRLPSAPLAAEPPVRAAPPVASWTLGTVVRATVATVMLLVTALTINVSAVLAWAILDPDSLGTAVRLFAAIADPTIQDQL